MDDPAVPFGAGYGESKWVTEHVLQNVSAKTDVHTVVMRLGQVAGDKLGYWNESEWFPALVKSALFQRCLPDVDGVRDPLCVQSARVADDVCAAGHLLVPCVRSREGVR